jgi:ribonuclease-3
MPKDLAEALGYRFRERSHLEQALTHRSARAQHNERIEFVGDGVLNCVIAVLLFERFPDLPEGQLSRLRANLVNRDTLHELALSLDVGEHLRLGEGESRSGGATRPSILADALEAVFGAIFLDGGFDAAREVISRLYERSIAALNLGESSKDAKTRLQEYLQGRRLSLPVYSVLSVAGEAHAQTFEVSCELPELGVRAQGTGKSRRAAEQEAAGEAYRLASGGGA